MKKGENFIQLFRFQDDESKKGRVLSSVKVGDVYMSRLCIEPGILTGNKYHKETNRIFGVEKGKVRLIFEDIKTKERKDLILEPGTHVVHVPPEVAFACKNIGEEPAVLVFFTNRALRDKEDSFPYELLEY